MVRRHFLSKLPAIGALGLLSPIPVISTPIAPADDRAYCVSLLTKIARPVLTALSKGTLKKSMPVEASPKTADGRRQVTHLEALGRTLAGLAPWLELGPDNTPEGALRQRIYRARPEGTFPPVGRSLAYRCGAFQLLAQLALQHRLPPALPPGQVRSALTAVIKRSLEPKGTFDSNGWLTVGFCGHQPSVGETYISTGSVYLCTVAFLPLGLPPSDPYWSDPSLPWTSQKAYSGNEFPIDHAL